jgi:hypothetical protein
MPQGDRTGPIGAGPRSGRGLGYCGGYDAPGFANMGFGFRMGWGRGRCGGFGWQHRSFGTRQAGWGLPRYAPPTQEENLQALKAEADWLKGQLNAINKHIEELEK